MNTRRTDPTASEQARIQQINVSLSPGEVLDRFTILQIKSERIADPDKLAHVRAELQILRDAAAPTALLSRPDLQRLTANLTHVNQKLWEIENALRACERDGNFGHEFVSLARAVYHANDQRAALKREVNLLLGSNLIDEKSHPDYTDSPGTKTE